MPKYDLYKERQNQMQDVALKYFRITGGETKRDRIRIKLLEKGWSSKFNRPS
jgi:hypothetical protein